jgi:hypothetical protein
MAGETENSDPQQIQNDDYDADVADGVDADIQRMSESAMAILDSITDEFNELTKELPPKSSKSPRSRSISPTSSDDEHKQECVPHSSIHDMAVDKQDKDQGNDSSDDQDDMSDDESIVNELYALQEVTREIEREMKLQNTESMQDAIARIEPSLKDTKLKKLITSDDKDIIKRILKDKDQEDDAPMRFSFRDKDDSNNDEDDMSDDESIVKELYALREVTREIEREIKSQNTESMQDAIAQIEQSPDDTKLKKLITSDDKEIIRRILEDEMKKNQPKNAIEGFVHRYNLYGPGAGGEELNIPLLAVTVAIWAIVIGLLVKTMYFEDI